MLPTSVLLIALTTSFAPVPPPPAKKPVVTAPSSRLAGAWRMVWGTGSGDVVFSQDGGYWTMWSGQQWIGSWELKDGVLFITEGKVPSSPDGVSEAPIRWQVRMDKTGQAGECEHEGRRFAFRLERAEQLKAPKAEQP